MSHRTGHTFRADPARARLDAALTLAKNGRETARRLLATLPSHWTESKAQNAVPEAVWTSAKQISVDLASALDYVATELESAGIGPTSGNAHFPAARPGQSEADFLEWLKGRLPGIERAPSVKRRLLELQHFGKPDCGWVHLLQELSNVFKHRGPPHHHLTVHRFTATKEGYVPRRGEEYMIEMEGFDGDVGQFLLRASEAVVDFIRCMRGVVGDGYREGCRSPTKFDPLVVAEF